VASADYCLQGYRLFLRGSHALFRTWDVHNGPSSIRASQAATYVQSDTGNARPSSDTVRQARPRTDNMLTETREPRGRGFYGPCYSPYATHASIVSTAPAGGRTYPRVWNAQRSAMIIDERWRRGRSTARDISWDNRGRRRRTWQSARCMPEKPELPHLRGESGAHVCRMLRALTEVPVSPTVAKW
jgi:hypothetical protein